MAIILRLDRVMADRKISLGELSERVGVSNDKNRKGERHPFQHLKRHLPGAELPAGRYHGV